MQDQYSAGKTVYNGGMHNAHSGTLDPSGYIGRESNRRSGLAAVALARKDQNKSQGPGVTKKSLNTMGLYVSPTGKIGRLK